MDSDLALSMLQPDKLVLTGVSGGPDSLALLHFLHNLGFPVMAASFNHQLRPEASADVEFVRTEAARLGLPFVTSSADVAALARKDNLSIEEAARELRYRFLFAEARKAGAQAVAVGHNADDQAETVLMHFLRGAGLSGLKGMPARLILPVFDAEIPLVRPLLGWTRAQTEAYCREHNLQPRTDLTNTDTHYFRNRLRHELLPHLEQYNPNIRHSLAKTAQALQGDYALLDELIETAWQKTVRSNGAEYVEFERAELEKLSPALIRNLFRRAAFLLKPGLRDVDFESLARVAALKPVELAGGLKTYAEGSRLYLTTSENTLPTTAWPQIRAEISLSRGITRIENGWFFNCEECIGQDIMTDASQNSDRFIVWLDPGLNSNRLLARPPHTGDRFEPLGMPRQTTRLADLFINLKIIKRLRQGWPVVCIGETIAWVPGLRMAEPFKINAQTKRAIKIELKNSTGPL